MRYLEQELQYMNENLVQENFNRYKSWSLLHHISCLYLFVLMAWSWSKSVSPPHHCFYFLLYPVSWLLCGTTQWRSSTRWLLNIRNRKGSWCSVRDCSTHCRLVLSHVGNVTEQAETLAAQLKGWQCFPLWKSCKRLALCISVPRAVLPRWG